ncbi:MAG: cobalt-precorrin-5B (C(1))-methyltransferase CbiD [Oscillospiraceae bacterium]
MEEYVIKDGKKLRLGYTTGSCAAAAAKAAAWMLLTGHEKRTIDLLTPKGVALTLDVLEIMRTPDTVSCAIRKDSGDDPDVTHDTLVFAAVQRTETPGVTIDGGAGVGRVTKRGLDQPVGAAAINSVPRRMIRENVEEVMRLCDYRGGLAVTISVPEGEALAKKTFNPRLGIVGGIPSSVRPASSSRQRRPSSTPSASSCGSGELGRERCSRPGTTARFYPGFHRHRPNGGPDQQFYRRRAGIKPGTGLSRRAFMATSENS